MKKAVLVVGVLLTLAGLVWILQGGTSCREA